MNEPFDSVDLTAMVADLNADGVGESLVTDYNGDLVADSVLSDLDGDGLADIGEFDTDADGYSDVLGIDTGRDGVADVAFVDGNYDGSADTVSTADDSAEPTEDDEDTEAGTGGDLYAVADSDEETADSSADIDNVPSYDVPSYDVPSGTQAVLDMVNSATKDAGTLYRDAMDPGSVSADEVAAANERIDNAAQNSRALEGHIYQQEVTNDIRSDELARQTSEEAHETATDAWIEAERAISRANDVL